MFDRIYFETLLGEQVAWLGQSVTVKVKLTDQRELEARSLFAAHEGYVILDVYPARERLGWTEGMPPDQRWTFDQVVAPYEAITWVELTTRRPEEKPTAKPIGFHAKAT